MVGGGGEGRPRAPGASPKSSCCPALRSSPPPPILGPLLPLVFFLYYLIYFSFKKMERGKEERACR